jgi:hypothetical protein
MRDRLKDRRVILALTLTLALLLGVVVLYVGPMIRFRGELKDLRQICAQQSEDGRKKQAEKPDGFVYPPFGDLIYVPNQVILTGSPSTINTVTKTLGLDLEPTSKKFSLSYSPQDRNEREMEVHLYQIPDGQTVEQVACEVNGLRGISLEEYDVSANPNYYISPAGWSGGGSPWTQNGEWAEDGGGWGKAQLTDFRRQWALGLEGIELLDASGDRMTEYMGNDVRVAVFDTSPFILPVNVTRTIEEIREADPPLKLTVRHHELVPAPNCPGRDRQDPRIDREKQDISNHGLFVAGLVHAVAPHSEIHLIRVLENDGCGDLFTIESAIESFIRETLDDNEGTLNEGTLKGTVINLSLGVHQPPKPKTFGLPEEVASLKHTVQKAIEHGAVVVAAAGNDSYNVPTATSMEIPANGPSVIGVAASNNERKRGCFSNEGDIAAPGGDGINSCEVPGRNPDSDEYVCQEEPGFCLISLVHKPNPGYAYWVGTSFSTPLVSGLAALMLEKESGLIISTSSVNVASTISNTITAGACPPATPPTPHYLGAGIANVRHTMQGSACPTPILTP